MIWESLEYFPLDIVTLRGWRLLGDRSPKWEINLWYSPTFVKVWRTPQGLRLVFENRLRANISRRIGWAFSVLVCLCCNIQPSNSDLLPSKKVNIRIHHLLWSLQLSLILSLYLWCTLVIWPCIHHIVLFVPIYQLFRHIFTFCRG